MTTLTIDTVAEAINREHALACDQAKTAIQHGIRCGELLAAKKAELTHGEFMPWVAAHCVFKYSTAARYMKAAKQISTGVEILALSDLFPSGRLVAGSARDESASAPSIEGMVKNAARDVIENETTHLRAEADADRHLLRAGDTAAAARAARRIERWEQVSQWICASIVQESSEGLRDLGLSLAQIKSFHVAVSAYLADGVPFNRAFERAAAIIFTLIDVHLDADDIEQAADSAVTATT